MKSTFYPNALTLCGYVHHLHLLEEEVVKLGGWRESSHDVAKQQPRPLLDVVVGVVPCLTADLAVDLITNVPVVQTLRGKLRRKKIYCRNDAYAPPKEKTEFELMVYRYIYFEIYQLIHSFCGINQPLII